MLSIVITSSSFINGDFLTTVTSAQDTKTPAYQNLIDQLRKLRNLQRRSDILVKYIYIVRQNSSGQYSVLADAEEDPKDKAYFGESAPIYTQDPQQLGHFAFVTPTSYTNKWGTWFTAYAPIYDSQAHVVAVLGMDVPLHAIEAELNKLITYGSLALAGSMGIAIFVAYLLANLLTRSLRKIYIAIQSIREGDLTTTVDLHTKDEFNQLAMAINEMTLNLQEKNRLTAAFGRYVSHHVLQTLLQSKQLPSLEGERRKVTVLFCDIHQFTLVAETLNPELVVSLLNEYLEKMIHIIFSYQGTLDKFIGDGIMAEFGIPLEDPLQELHATQAALCMQEAFELLAVKWKRLYNCEISIGIGIHTGLAIVGNIGSEVHMEYTAIGDTVNVASRLEKATKELSTTLVLSEETYKGIPESSEVTCKDLGVIQLYGRNNPIRAYTATFVSQGDAS